MTSVEFLTEFSVVQLYVECISLRPTTWYQFAMSRHGHFHDMTGEKHEEYKMPVVPQLAPPQYIFFAQFCRGKWTILTQK